MIENLTFHYGKKNQVLKINRLQIPAHQAVGLVGRSGSGKSTFVHLLLRYFDLQSGAIFIDGQDIAKVQQSSLRSQIALIPQEISLFHRSLLENLRLAKPEASEEEVIEACKIARCHDFIMKLPKGYQTITGERGGRLSGGQRQRIAIARALLNPAPIVIFDEATSALDALTEKAIQEDLGLLMRDRTILVIAHRLSTLKQMERLLVFHEGQIVEDGPFDKLLAQNGQFKELWSTQGKGFLP